MVTVTEKQPGVFEVKTVNSTVKALEVAYGTTAMEIARRRLYAQIEAANAPAAVPYTADLKRKIGTKIYGV